MNEFMVLIHPWNPKTCYVKEREFFLDQGGGKDKWGKAWRLVHARDIEDARTRGLKKHPKGTYEDHS
jgi:hypothetical protein